MIIIGYLALYLLPRATVAMILPFRVAPGIQGRFIRDREVVSFRRDSRCPRSLSSGRGFVIFDRPILLTCLQTAAGHTK